LVKLNASLRLTEGAYGLGSGTVVYNEMIQIDNLNLRSDSLVIKSVNYTDLSKLIPCRVCFESDVISAIESCFVLILSGHNHLGGALGLK